jgi:EmrB/QacA subfamily drug resistance transporter
MGTAGGRWVLVATITGSSLAMLDATVVNVALQRIGEDLDAGFTSLQWISNAYTLTLAAFILLGGVLGDRVGRRRIFIVGTIWFALASALCAVSTSAGLLIAARALQGVGAALLTPGSLAIISATFVRTDRARAVGAWSGLGGIAAAVGPFLGGWLVALNWRLVFLINLPLALAIVLIAARHVPETRDTSAAAHRRIDLMGAVTVVLALSGITYALTEAGSQGWRWTVLLAGAVGVGASAAFVLVERRAANPLIRLDLFADRVFAATNVATVFIYAALSIFFFLVVLQLQRVAGWSPLSAGTSMLPATALMLLLSARFGALSERIGPRSLMAVGSLLAGAGFVAAVRIGSDAAYLTDVLPAAVLLGLGLACAVAPLTAAVLAAAPDNLAGAASGINNATARSAGLLAIAVVPVVTGLSVLAPEDVAGFARGFQMAMLVGAGLLGAAAAVSWFGVGPSPVVSPPTPTGTDGNRLDIHRDRHCAAAGPPSHPADPAEPEEDRRLVTRRPQAG